MCWCSKQVYLHIHPACRVRCSLVDCCGAMVGRGHMPNCPSRPQIQVQQLIPEEIELKPKLSRDELFQKFIDEFPVLTALDLFCNKCARPMNYTFIDSSNMDAFGCKFSCHEKELAIWLLTKQYLETGSLKLDKEAVLTTIEYVRG